MDQVKVCDKSQQIWLMWKTEGIETKDRFEALCGIVLPEFVKVADSITIRFNMRQATQGRVFSVMKLQDIPSQFVVDDDYQLKDAFNNLEHALCAQEAMQNLMNSLLNSIGSGMSGSELIGS